ncbi:MAG: hypothetical protein JO042_06740 [Sinobacteraceae bacterium]|nr:hypothetical protein [Nevskiaceae bacterium]
MAPERTRLLHYLGLALVLLSALALDLYSGDSMRYKDEFDYEQVARSMLHQHQFADADGNLTMDRPPGYPGAIALAYSIVERPLAVKIENAFVLVLAVLVLGAVARRVAERADSLVPYLVLAYPLITYAASVLYPQVLGCLLLSIVVLLLAQDRLSIRQTLLAGICYGLLILAIPYFALLLPLMALCVLLRNGSLKQLSLKPAIVMFVIPLLVVAPWTIRNYHNFHVLVPVSANNGKNLFIGNSPITTPTSGRTADVMPLCKGVHPGMTEYDFDTTMRGCAIDWITHNPGDAARLYVGKVIAYFNYRNEIATPGQSAAWRDWLVFATYYPLLLLALLRLALVRRYPLHRAEVLIYVLYFLNALPSAIFFPRLRFRIPFDFLLIAVDAAFLARWWASRLRAGASLGVAAERSM